MVFCCFLTFLFYSALFLIGYYCYYTNKIKKEKYNEDFQRNKMLKEKRQKERKDNFEKLEKQFPFTEEAEKITKYEYKKLIQMLQTRELKAVEVLTAYMAKAIHSNKLYNSITEFIPNAMELAEELDNSPEIVGPLHGLPVAIKEDYNIEGLDVTLGLSKWLYKPKSESATIVQVLQKDLGAIPFCRTNVPQTLLSIGSENPIYGTTLNPINTSLTPGGSSSGSGSLIASGGTLVAFGSDLGGSIRIPSTFCGICGIKPSTGRLSHKNIVQCIENIVGITATPGPMAKRATTVAEIFKELTLEKRQNKRDTLALPINWDNQIFTSKTSLTIGYYTETEAFPLLGDVEETILKAKSHLESLGHKLIPIDFIDHFELLKIAGDIFEADHGDYLKKMISGEEISPILKMTAEGTKINFYKATLLKYLSDMGSSFINWNESKSTKVQKESGLGVIFASDLWVSLGKRSEAIEKILSKMESLNMDLILCPVLPFAGCRLEDVEYLKTALAYTLIWNLLDFPAGVVPFGKESGKIFDNFEPKGNPILEIAKESVRNSVGSSIGVQIVGKRFCEEIVLRAMVELDSVND